LVDTFEPATIATSGRFGAVRGAECVVHVDVAELRHFLRKLVGIFLFALVDAAVFEQHDRARRDVHAVFDPVRHQRHVTAEQFGQTLRDRRQRIFRLEVALGRTAQVRRDHHGGAGVKRGADRRHGGADASVFGDLAGIVLRHVEVGANEYALVAQGALVDQVLQSGEIEDGIHGFVASESRKNAILPDEQATSPQAHA
jgi:hypothetical protein